MYTLKRAFGFVRGVYDALSKPSETVTQDSKTTSTNEDSDKHEEEPNNTAITKVDDILEVICLPQETSPSPCTSRPEENSHEDSNGDVVDLAADEEDDDEDKELDLDARRRKLDLEWESLSAKISADLDDIRKESRERTHTGNCKIDHEDLSTRLDIAKAMVKEFSSKCDLHLAKLRRYNRAVVKDNEKLEAEGKENRERLVKLAKRRPRSESAFRAIGLLIVQSNVACYRALYPDDDDDNSEC